MFPHCVLSQQIGADLILSWKEEEDGIYQQ